MSAFKQEFEALASKIKQIKADYPCDAEQQEEKFNYLLDAVSSTLNRMNEKFYRLEESFWEYQYQHSKGHLPAISSPSQMKSALKALGLDEDYQIDKKYLILASDRAGNQVMVAEFKKKE